MCYSKRKAGKLLAEIERGKPGRPKCIEKTSVRGGDRKSIKVVADDLDSFTVEEAGISRKRSSRAQKIEAIRKESRLKALKTRQSARQERSNPLVFDSSAF